MAKLQVVDPIELTQRIQKKISALIKSEIDKDRSDLTKIETLMNVNDIVIATLTEMVNEAKAEILNECREKAQ